jgi:hypothetical protein
MDKCVVDTICYFRKMWEVELSERGLAVIDNLNSVGIGIVKATKGNSNAGTMYPGAAITTDTVTSQPSV